MKKSLTGILILLAIIRLNGQETIQNKNTFRGTRFVNSQSANLAEKGEFLLLIQHRFGDISNGFYELFGLDQASMRLGFEFGIGKAFNLGIGRSTYMKTFDAFGKFRITSQSDHFPLTMSLSTGGSIPTIRNFFPDSHSSFSDKYSANTQLHIAWSNERIGIQFSPGYLKTGYILAQNKNLSFATAGVGLSMKLSKKSSVNLEYLHPFTNDLKSNPLSLGFDIDTGGHLFQLVVSNSQRMFDQGIFTDSSGDWLKGHLYFGFNLVRSFNYIYQYE